MTGKDSPPPYPPPQIGGGELWKDGFPFPDQSLSSFPDQVEDRL